SDQFEIFERERQRRRLLRRGGGALIEARDTVFERQDQAWQQLAARALELAPRFEAALAGCAGLRLAGLPDQGYFEFVEDRNQRALEIAREQAEHAFEHLANPRRQIVTAGQTGQVQRILIRQA